MRKKATIIQRKAGFRVLKYRFNWRIAITNSITPIAPHITFMPQKREMTSITGNRPNPNAYSIPNCGDLSFLMKYISSELLVKHGF
jgi:hypothetical protein